MKQPVLAEVQLSSTLPASQTNAPRVDLPLKQPDLFIPLVFLVLWAIATTMYTGLPKYLQKVLFKLKPQQRVPCRECQFFSSNPYIQCALHPLTVQTEQATNCSDYRNKQDP